MNNRLTLVATAALVAIPVEGVRAADDHDDEHHNIEEIIVTATPIERSVEQLAQPTSVVSRDELTRNESSSIGETLVGQPGVSATYFGPVSSRPVIRGQYGERVRVLTNGLDSLDAAALSEDHAVALDAILADHVEIVRGPATLLYGSGAAGGIVNIVDSRIARAPLEEPVSGTLSLGSNSATGREAAALSVDAGSAGLALHADYFYRETDDIEVPGFAESARQRALEGILDEGEGYGIVENTSSTTEAGALGLTLTDEAGYTGLVFSRYTTNYGVPGHAHEGEDGGEEEAPVRIDLDQARYDLRGELDLGGALDGVRFALARNDYTHTEFEGAEPGTKFDSLGTDMRFEFRHAPGDRLEGAFGLQYKKLDFAAAGDEAFVPSSDTQQFSAFVFEEYRLNDRWALQGSARAEHQSIETADRPEYDDWAYGVSLGAVWTLSDPLTLSANLALTERHPNSTELYADGPHVAVQRFETGSVVLGDGVFDKETSTNIDLTLAGAFERVEFTLTGFINSVDDYILLRPTAAVEDDLPVFEYDQADVDLYGFEAEMVIEVFDFTSSHLHAHLTSDIVYAEEADSGADLPRIPPFRAGFGLHYTRGPLEADVEAMWHDDQDRVAAEELPTDDYTLVSASVSYRFADGDVLVFLKGTNLTDEEARRHSSPLKDLVPLPGRALQAGLRWDF